MCGDCRRVIYILEFCRSEPYGTVSSAIKPRVLATGCQLNVYTMSVVAAEFDGSFIVRRSPSPILSYDGTVFTRVCSQHNANVTFFRANAIIRPHSTRNNGHAY